MLPYRTADDRIAGVVVTFFEITARMQSEQRLRASEAQFRELAEGAPDPLVIADESGAITLANRAAADLFGHDPATMRTMRIDALVPERWRGLCLRRFRGALAEGRVRTLDEEDLRALRSDGREVPVEATLGRITIPEGFLVSISIRDVTERRRADEALSRARQAKANALETRSRFLAAASHDLRQPLESLAADGARLMDLVADPEARRILAEQRRGLDAIRALLDALLDVARLDPEGAKPEIGPVALLPLLEEIRDEFAALAAQRGLSLLIESAPLTVTSDAGLLGQILRTLVMNAIRLSESGSIRIGAEAVGSGGTVRIVLRAAGAEGAAGGVPRLFDAFRARGGEETAPASGAQWLGLANVRQIAGLAGAEIALRSDEGEDPCLSIVLPAADRPGTPDTAPG